MSTSDVLGLTDLRHRKFNEFYARLAPDEQAALDVKLERWRDVIKARNPKVGVRIAGMQELFMALIEEDWK